MSLASNTTVPPPQHADFAALPKVELHRHLEGSPRLSTVAAIARAHALDLPHETEALRPLVQVVARQPRTIANFLGKFRVLRTCFTSEAAIRQIAYEAVLDAAADGILYLELRFTPAALDNRVQAGFAQVVAWVCDAVREGEADAALHGTPIMVRLLLSLNRHESAEVAEHSLAAALAHPECGTRLVGLDFSGREDGYPLAPFARTLDRARDAGLSLTLHAGEWLGAESVRETLDLFQPPRIGHGVRAAESGEVMAELAAKGTVLEICPSSNVDSGIYSSLADHPLPTLMEQGVKITLNSDDPLVCGVTLSEELARTAAGCGLTMADVQAAMLTAAGAAFLPEAERAALVQKLAAVAGTATTPTPDTAAATLVSSA